MPSRAQEHVDEDLASRILIGETLTDVRAAGSNLSGWRFTASAVRALSLRDSQFGHWTAHGVRWERLTLDHCVGRYGFYSDCSFDDLEAHSSILNASHFVNCRFDRTRSELSSFGLCAFQGTQWSRSRLSEVAFIATVWHNCEFLDADCSFVRFPGALFVDTSFRHCSLRKAIFRRARFVRCRFENCRLTDSVFHHAEFTDTAFDQTDIHQAANLEGIQGLDQ